jgi:hypothetical protein
MATEAQNQTGAASLTYTFQAVKVCDCCGGEMTAIGASENTIEYHCSNRACSVYSVNTFKAAVITEVRANSPELQAEIDHLRRLYEAQIESLKEDRASLLRFLKEAREETAAAKKEAARVPQLEALLSAVCKIENEKKIAGA